ncbi:unnamed protein product [Phytomonas sp. Hart1]|nr:unnamed protein product [Phytomonas sp. Hart1]|eukprot:CCW71889.1 unnamed protein product [Phytomonas sp. isolate Hart1]
MGRDVFAEGADHPLIAQRARREQRRAAGVNRHLREGGGVVRKKQGGVRGDAKKVRRDPRQAIGQGGAKGG